MLNRKWYKITLGDSNLSPICSGCTFFFTENLDEFQENWFVLETDDGVKDRFLKSKNGEIVTDTFSDDPKLNIVQQDNISIFAETEFTLKDREFEAYNTYGYPSTFYFKELIIYFKWIKFKDEYFRIAKFKANGICEKRMNGRGYEEVWCWGNKVIENLIEYEAKSNIIEPKESFNNNKLESICYLTNGTFKNETDIKKDIKNFEIDKTTLSILFSDVVGEAG